MTILKYFNNLSHTIETNVFIKYTKSINDLIEEKETKNDKN